MNQPEKVNTGRKRKYTKDQLDNNPYVAQGKVPPQAIDMEEAVLGALMLERDALTNVIDILRGEMFYKEAHERIYDAIHRLFAKSEPVDLLTVTNELKNNAELDLVGGPYYLTQLTSRIASAANIEYHARIISEKYIQRELIRISTNIINDAYEDTTDVFDLLDKAEDSLFKVNENNIRKGAEEMHTILKESLRQIEEASKQDGNVVGVPSGFTDLDRLTAGWQRSDLIILAARPGMGKTAFVLSMARNIAVDHGRTVAVFSLEMASTQIVTRIISSETELSSEKLKKGLLTPDEWDRLNSKINKLSDAKLVVDDTPGISIFELRAKCRRIVQKYNGIDLIIIDYLQLMTGGGNDGNREQEISTISRSLKALAKELNVPIICLSQLNRSVETRGGDKKPQLSDLRESGAIEQDADMVMFIYRPEYYNILEDEEGNSTKNMAQLIVAKHRNGGLEDINLRFEGQFAKFSDYVDSNFEFTPPSISPNQSFDADSNTITVQSRMNDMGDDDDFAPF